MTLANIIRRSLIELGRGTDAQSTNAWQEKLTMFANDAVQDLVEYLELRKTDKVTAQDNVIKLGDLSSECIKVVEVRQGDKPIVFETADASDEIRVKAEGEVDVEYRYAPKEMKDDVAKPDIPEYLQRLIVSYVVYREHLTADPTMQRRADAFYRLYEEGKRKASKTRGEADTYKIYNNGW